MLYPFMTLPDETEIVHSEMILSDGIKHVKVCIEKPVEGGFQSAICWLPENRWEKVTGYTQEELDKLHKLIQSRIAEIYQRAGEYSLNLARITNKESCPHE